nr:8777_t:CDS:1 [Entrophospora candida]
MSSTENISEKLSSDTSNVDLETHNYPFDKKIIYKSPNHSFIYNIIKEGIYPNEPKYTQANSNGKQYPIPDEYLVETEFGKKKHILKCSPKYHNDKFVFYLNWKDNENENCQVTSEKSATDATQKYLNKTFSFCL